MVELETAGFNPVVWLESLFKRLIEATAGRGGIEAICQYLDQIDFIPELRPLRQNIKLNSIFFETALSKCNKEQLKRPVQIRREEIVDFLGCKCQKCGFTATLWMLMEIGDTCPNCKGTLSPLYATVMAELVERKIGVSPEAVLMFEAYDRLAQAYVSCYHALRLVMDKTAELFGWEHFRISQPELRSYMDQYFLGRLAGETHIPREEKQLLQFLVRGNLAIVPEEEAEKLIELGMDVVKYGYLYEVLGATGAHKYYAKALTKYNRLYDRLNEQIRIALTDFYAEKRKQVIRVNRTLGGYYAPCLIMPKRFWESGQIAKEISLEPVYRLPIFPKADFGALQTVYGPLGSGKTFLEASIICYSVLSKHELVFSPLNDKTNTLTLAGLPLFAHNKRTKRLLHILQGILGVEPQGIPTLTLTVLRKGEKVEDVAKHPPTIFDRIIEIDDPRGFKVNFNTVLRELKKIAESYGFSRPVGVVNVRNLDRFAPKEKINIDAQVAANMLNEFDKWRKSHLSQPARTVIDEVSYLASSQVILYAGDALRAAATISDFIKESRRNLLSLDLCTQTPLELISNIRDAATNVFFRDLPTSKDKTRSQIDFLLECLQLEDPSIKNVVRDINNRGLLGKGYWFWYHQPSRGIEVIKPCPPTFYLIYKQTPYEIFKLYEKNTGEKILLENWEQVETIEASKTKEKRVAEIL